MESSFTCLRLFRPEFRASFVLDDDESAEFNPFGDSTTVFPTMVFYACMLTYSDKLTPKILRGILNKIRSILYPTGKSPSLSISEELFLTDVMELFFLPPQVSSREVSAQVISTLRRVKFTNVEIERGRSILLKSSKLSPDQLTEEGLAFFVMNYFSQELFSSSVSRAVGAFLTIVSIFSSYNTPQPGQVARTSWMDKITDRIMKVALIRRISLAGVPVTDTANKIVGEILSGPISSFSKEYQIPAPYSIPESPKLGPQKSPKSPPVLDDSGMLGCSEQTSRLPVIHVLPSPTSAGSISLKPSGGDDSTPNKIDNTQDALELVKQSLLKSGMSPSRSARIASQFVAGGSANMDALNRVLQQAKTSSNRRASQEKIEARNKRGEKNWVN